MFSIIASFSLYLLAVSAAPWGPSSYGNGPGGYRPSSGQVPFKFPLPNGFPNIQIPSAALTAIEQQAHGTLPNGPLPSSVQDASVTTLQAIAFGELFETAYFTSLLNNITQRVPGFEVGSEAVRNIVINALTAVQAQEELHAIGVNGILSNAGRTPVKPCEYIFPADNFDSSLEVASIFTDLVVLGGLQDALSLFSTDGDQELVPLLVSVQGQEGEQNGFYRSVLQKIPSQLPFLTRSAGPFGFSFMNQFFVVPGTCPTSINVPVFGILSVESSDVEAKDQQLTFSFTKNATTPTSGLSLVYLNQQNTPIVEPLQNTQTVGDKVIFTADFPYSKYLMDGLTIAAVTNSAGPFSSADQVANATLFGPGVIEIY